MKNIFNKIFKKEDKNKIENELKEIFKNDDLGKIIENIISNENNSEILQDFSQKFGTKEGYSGNDIKFFSERIDQILQKNEKEIFIDKIIFDNFKKGFFYQTIGDNENSLKFYDKEFEKLNSESSENENIYDLENIFALYFNTANIEFYRKNYKSALELYDILLDYEGEKFKNSMKEVETNTIKSFLCLGEIKSAFYIYQNSGKEVKKNLYFKEIFKAFDFYQNAQNGGFENLLNVYIDGKNLTEQEVENIIFYYHHFLYKLSNEFDGVYISIKSNIFGKRGNLNLKEFFEKNLKNNSENIRNFSVENLFQINLFQDDLIEAKKYYEIIMQDLENFSDISLFLEIMLFEKKSGLSHKNSDNLYNLINVNIDEALKINLSSGHSKEEEKYIFDFLIGYKNLAKFYKTGEELSENELNFLAFTKSKNVSFDIFKHQSKKLIKDGKFEEFFEFFRKKFGKNFDLKTEEPYFSEFLNYYFIKMFLREKNPLELIEEVFETKKGEHIYNEALFYISNSDKTKKENQSYFFLLLGDIRRAKEILERSDLREKNPELFFYRKGSIKFYERNFEDAILDFVESQKFYENDIINYLNSTLGIFGSLVELGKTKEAKNLETMIENLLKGVKNPTNQSINFFNYYKNILEEKTKKEEF